MKSRSCGTSFIKSIKNIFKLVRVFFSRLLFVSFCIVSVYALTTVIREWESQGWYFLILLIPLLVESLYALCRPGYGQTKWLMPHVFLFLIAAIPPISILEVNTIAKVDRGLVTKKCNKTSIFNEGDEINILEQVFIFFIILSKWLLPKHKMTLDDLTQLLLANIAAGADIVEFFSVLKDDSCSLIRSEKTLKFVVGAVTLWSLLQFALNLTATKTFADESIGVDDLTPVSTNNQTDKKRKEPNKERSNFVQDEEVNNYHARSRIKSKSNKLESSSKCNYFCFYNEIWGLLLCILFQDGPFLVVRLIILFQYKFFSSANIFFGLKNLFVVILYLNRIRAIFKEERGTWLSRIKHET